MTPEEQRERVIQDLANILRTTPFKVELVVKKKPAGITILYEVTQEHIDAMLKKQQERRVNNESNLDN